MNLGGRRALVTGVSRRAGIGYAIARRLLEAEAAVFIQGWTEHDAAQPWGGEPGGTAAVAGELDVPFAEVDFADPAAPEGLVAAAAETVAAAVRTAGLVVKTRLPFLMSLAGTLVVELAGPIRTLFWPGAV